MEAGKATGFTVTFTEMGEETKLGSAQLFIPDSLVVDDSQKPSVPEGWGSSWDNPDDSSSFGKILSLWALLTGNYLNQGESVSATFTATAGAEQTHHFDTKAWTEASGGDGTESNPHTGVGATTNNYYGHSDDNGGTYTKAYSQPKVNVWVDGGSGYAKGGSSNGSLARGDGLDDLDAAREHDGDLFAGLENVRDNLNWHYVQADDIDLDSNGDWDPIGSEDDPFIGAFDGNEKTISNLKIDDTDEWDIGLFGHAAESAVINNVNLTDVDIIAGGQVGALVGTNKGKIINSSAAGEIQLSEENGQPWAVGGLIGFNAGGVITGSSADVNITVGSSDSRVSEASSIGGLVGANGYNNPQGNDADLIGGSISGCHAAGNIAVFATGDVEYVGGLIGFNREAGITGSHATGSITIDTDDGEVEYVGGLIGGNGNYMRDVDFHGGSIINSYYETGTLDIIAASDEVWHVGGLAGYSSGGDVTLSRVGETDNPVTIKVGAAGNVWGVGGLVGDFDHGTITGSGANTDISVGSESTKDYEGIGGLIGSGDHAEISNSSAKGSITVGTSDRRVRSATQIGGLAGSVANVNLISCAADIAIAIFAADGSTEYIGGLVGWLGYGDLSGSSAYGDIAIDANGPVGLIGGLIGENDSGSVSSGNASGDLTITAQGNVQNIGGLIGKNDDGTVEVSFAASDIEIDAGSSRIGLVGGLVGHNLYGTVTASWSDSNITATTTGEIDTIGGLIGYNVQGTISDSKANSSIDLKGEDIGEVGGLVGDNANGEIRNNYALGVIKIEANDVLDSIGGLLGFNSGSNSTVENCYAVVEIMIISDTDIMENSVGGLVGYVVAGDVTSSFYLDRGTYNNGIGTPESETAMKTLALYADAGWSILPYTDFDPANPQAATWYIKEGEDYPILWWEHSRYGEVVRPAYSFSSLFFGDDLEMLQLRPVEPSSVKRSIFDRIMALLAPLATAEFMSSGDHADLENARMSYALALQLFKEKGNLLTGDERSILNTYFALAETALLSLETRLHGIDAMAFGVSSLADRFNKSRRLFGQNRHLLSAEQVAAAEAFLAAVHSLITSPSSI